MQKGPFGEKSKYSEQYFNYKPFGFKVKTPLPINMFYPELLNSFSFTRFSFTKEMQWNVYFHI